MNGSEENAPRVADTMQRKHYIPEDGHKHIASADCWCHPKPAEEGSRFYIHNPFEPGIALMQ